MGDTPGVLVKDWKEAIRYPVVYRVTTESRIALALLGLLFGACGVMLAWTLWQRHLDPAGAAAMGLMVLGLLAVPVYGAAYAANASLTLERDAIEVRKAFSSRRLRLADIQGRRIGQGRSGRYRIIVPFDRRPLMIDGTSFGLDDRFQAWFNALPDLTAQEQVATRAQVENDPSLGRDAHERLARLDRARRLAKVLNAAPMALLLWAMVYPRPYAIVIACAALLPWLGVAMAWARPNLFQLDGKPGDVRPNVGTLLYMPPLVLGLRALFDITLVDRGPLLLWGLLLGLPLCLAALLAPRAATAGRRVTIGLLMLPFAFAYGTGLLALADTRWDAARSEVYPTAVTGKEVSRGKTTTYYLDLAPWHPRIARNHVAVPRAYYDAVRRGDPVCVRLHPGRFGLRWMQVGGCG